MTLWLNKVNKNIFYHCFKKKELVREVYLMLYFLQNPPYNKNTFCDHYLSFFNIICSSTFFTFLTLKQLLVPWPSNSFLFVFTLLLLSSVFFFFLAYKQQNFFLIIQEAGKSKIKVPEHSVSDEGPFPHSKTAVLYLHVVERERALWGLFYKDTKSSHEIPTLMTQSPPKNPTFKYHHFGDRFQHEFWGCRHHQSITEAQTTCGDGQYQVSLNLVTWTCFFKNFY